MRCRCNGGGPVATLIVTASTVIVVVIVGPRSGPATAVDCRISLEGVGGRETWIGMPTSYVSICAYTGRETHVCTTHVSVMLVIIVTYMLSPWLSVVVLCCLSLESSVAVVLSLTGEQRRCGVVLSLTGEQCRCCVVSHWRAAPLWCCPVSYWRTMSLLCCLSLESSAVVVLLSSERQHNSDTALQ